MYCGVCPYTHVPASPSQVFLLELVLTLISSLLHAELTRHYVCSEARSSIVVLVGLQLTYVAQVGFELSEIL